MNLYEQPRGALPHGQMNFTANAPMNYAQQVNTPTQFRSNTPGVNSSPPTPMMEEGKRKRRLEIKNKSETKRRNKFNDQLNTLKDLLECDGTEESKITRDQVMSKAIQEIQRLKNLLRNQKDPKSPLDLDLGSVSCDTQVVIYNNQVKQSLNDPFNRYPWTRDDLDTTFHVLLTKEFTRIFHINRVRTVDVLLGTVKTLFDIADQLQKPEYKLYASVMEEVIYSVISVNPKELKRVLDRNLALYNQVKAERNVSEVILARGEISILLFSDFSLYHLLVGNVIESERIWNFAFKLSQQIVTYTTRNFILTGIPILNYWRGNISPDQALKFKELMKSDVSCRETAKFLTAQVLVKSGKYEEAIKAAEDGIVQLLELWGDTADVIMSALLIDTVFKAGQLDKALAITNASIKKVEELNIDGITSKAELLRLKAKILFNIAQQQIGLRTQRKAPARAPQLDDNSLFHVDNIAVHLNFNNFDGTVVSNSNNQTETQLVSKGPTDLVQIELLLQHASQLAKQKGLFLVEVRCAIDAAEVWLAYGDDLQKLEALHALEALQEQMTKLKAEQLDEFSTAQKLIAELKSHIVCLFPPVFEQNL